MKKLLLTIALTVSAISAYAGPGDIGSVEATPLARSVIGQCDQARMALGTAQESFVHLSFNKSDRASEAALNAISDTIYLTEQLTKSLCK